MTNTSLVQAERVINFIETFLSLGGSYSGQPFKLMEFQKEVLRDCYVTDENGVRLRQRYVLGLSRKSGKSQLAAALALFHLVIDAADPRPLIISAAADRSQARLVFDEAKRMVKASPDLSAELKVFSHEIQNPRNGGVYKAVSADAGLQQGLNPSFVVFDELHVFKNTDLLDALTMGSAMRRQPLFFIISTAGFSLDQPLGKLYQYGLRVNGHRLNGEVKKGELTDSSFGMSWYGPQPGEKFDYTDRATWQRFNPAWELLNKEVLESTFKTSSTNAFIRYHLNGWTSSNETFLPPGTWDALAEDMAIPEGDRVVLGFDGAWRGDCTALVAYSLDSDHMELLAFWEQPPNQKQWHVPVSEVEDEIISACDKYKVLEIAADPYRFEMSLTKLAEEFGLPIVEFHTNSLPRMVPACTTFREGVIAESFTHRDDPVLSRHLASAQIKEDAKGLRITKAYRSSDQHIDAAVAAVIAYYRARAHQDEPEATRRDPELVWL